MACERWQIEEKSIYLSDIGKRIQEKYSDQWIGITDVEYESDDNPTI